MLLIATQPSPPDHPDPNVKWIAVTRQEAELIIDSFKVSNPITKNLALKAMGMVMEFERDAAVAAAWAAINTHPSLAEG